MAKSCLITGAAGFIGSHLADKLLALGHRVFGVDNMVLGKRANLSTALKSPDFIFQELDVNDLKAFREFLKAQTKEPIDAVWHLAANSDIQAGGANPDIDLDRTFLTTYNTLKLMQEFQIPKIVFASTSAIYGELGGALTEQSGPLHPISNYGAMKLASEGIITAALERFLKQAWIYRFPNVVGSRATHGAIYDFLKKLKKNPTELEVLGDGSQEKPYLHVSELVDAMVFLFQKQQNRLNVFNIAPDGSASTVRFMAEATVRLAAPGAKIRYTGGSKGWIGNVSKFQYSIEKLKAAGWKPRLTSNETVELAIKENLAEFELMKQLVILAGGKGTRLKDRLGDLPKPMIPIGGKPLLEHQVELAKKYGFTDLIFFVHYRADLIEKHFGDGKKFGVQIRYVLEHEPLGTAGAVLAGFEQLSDRFVVMYGDTMVNVDLDRIWRAHERHHADATLLLHPNDHPFDSDLVEVNAESHVVAFHNRPHSEGAWRQNLVNAGLYVLEKKPLAAFRGTRNTERRTLFDFGKDLFPAMLKQGANLFGYSSPEYIKDIGTPQRYDRICAEFAAGVIARSSFATPQRAVFLDRDGTLVPDKDCLRNAEGLELLPHVAEALHQLNHSGWRAVLVTNQPVVAKGWCTEAELQNIHNKLETLLGREHAFLDRIYFCPHHPDKGFPGERVDLKIDCDCRKPRIGMIQSAMADLNIDLKQSWLIGDTTTDLQTAKNAGVKSILVRTGSAGKDGKHDARPDFTFDTLNEAVDFILSQKT